MLLVVTTLALFAAQEAVGIGSGPKGPGAPPDMQVSSGSDAPGTVGGVSRNPAVLRKVTPERVEAFWSAMAASRAAASAAAGDQTAGAADHRAALKADMEAWRDFWAVRQSEWNAHVQQWLPDTASLTARQWAQRRASWFDTRDAWIASKQKK
jgi:hypothetical protein